jgi:hypothetical protein
MAVTSANAARGRPSSWSAAVDQLCFEEANRRLIILSAGNIAYDLAPSDHLTRNDLEPVDDPAQAWNVLDAAGPLARLRASLSAPQAIVGETLGEIAKADFRSEALG